MDTITHQLKQRAHIRDVWCALGGSKLRGGRGQAFWRGGTGYSVALHFEKGLWHDHRDGVGGDVVALVRTVQQCSFREALQWLADFTGMDLSESRRSETYPDNDWPTDLKWATWWSMAAVVLAEDTLASLSCYDPDRRDLTALLARIRLGDAALVDEYRKWRVQLPRLTYRMTRAGRLYDARVQRRVALWLRRYLDEQQTA